MTLRAFQTQDYDTLISWIDSEHLNFLWSGPRFRFPLCAQQLAEHLQHTNVYAFMLTYQGFDAGYVELVQESSSDFRICRVFVAPKYRGLGLSKVMFRDLLTLAQQQFDQLKVLTLRVFEQNTAAKNLYESFGFITDSESEVQHGDQTWRLLSMHKQV